MQNRWSVRALSVLILLLAATTLLDARVLSQKSRKCPDGSSETWTLFEDDCSGDIYSLYVDCLGNTYLNVPEPQWRALFSEQLDPFPENFWEMVHMADLETPGALNGVHLINRNGEIVKFRNPLNQSEVAYYLQSCPSPTTIH